MVLVYPELGQQNAVNVAKYSSTRASIWDMDLTNDLTHVHEQHKMVGGLPL